MSGLALGLVLASALVHASWNFLLKKSGGGAGLITAACMASLVFYAPLVAAVLWLQPGYAFQPVHLALMAGSGAVHMAYFLLLDRAYRSGGDLSIVYPLARATGPLLTVVAAIAFLGERPGPTALAMGDVITHRDGTTVEVVNTDAEGRLVMADALVLARESAPDARLPATRGPR